MTNLFVITQKTFFLFSFLVKQIQLSPTQSIVSTFYYIIWNFIWKLFQVEMQQVTYITIPCLSTFKHSTFKAIKRCKQIAYFEDLGNPKQLLSRVAKQIYLTFHFIFQRTYCSQSTHFVKFEALNLLVRLNLKCEF